MSGFVGFIGLEEEDHVFHYHVVVVFNVIGLPP